MTKGIYYCDICGKEYGLNPEGLQRLQVRVEGVDLPSSIIGWVVCQGTCSDKVKTNEETVVVLTDLPYKGEVIGD